MIVFKNLPLHTSKQKQNVLTLEEKTVKCSFAIVCSSSFNWEKSGKNIAFEVHLELLLFVWEFVSSHYIYLGLEGMKLCNTLWTTNLLKVWICTKKRMSDP